MEGSGKKSATRHECNWLFSFLCENWFSKIRSDSEKDKTKKQHLEVVRVFCLVKHKRHHVRNVSNPWKLDVLQLRSAQKGCTAFYSSNFCVFSQKHSTPQNSPKTLIGELQREKTSENLAIELTQLTLIFSKINVHFWKN